MMQTQLDVEYRRVAIRAVGRYRASTGVRRSSACRRHLIRQIFQNPPDSMVSGAPLRLTMKYDDCLPGPVDRNRIELIEDHELRFWTREFGCSAVDLLNAIEAVGVDADAVGEYIALRQYAGTQTLPDGNGDARCPNP
jgi:Protein of unknown function (DUF3606)